MATAWHREHRTPSGVAIARAFLTEDEGFVASVDLPGGLVASDDTAHYDTLDAAIGAAENDVQARVPHDCFEAKCPQGIGHAD